MFSDFSANNLEMKTKTNKTSKNSLSIQLIKKETKKSLKQTNKNCYQNWKIDLPEYQQIYYKNITHKSLVKTVLRRKMNSFES